jgi:cytochrome P450 family 142 subfamily A polypeptide 1
MDPVFHKNPFEIYRWMRKNAPLYFDDSAPVFGGNGAWGASTYSLIRYVSTEHNIFSSASGSRPDAPPVPSMINTDEPEHLLRRSINRRRFSVRTIAAYEPYVRAVVTELIDTVLDKKCCDLVRDLAMPLPMRVIGRMMNLPKKDYAKLLEWSDLIATGLSNMPADFERKVIEAATEFEEYILKWFRKLEKSPGDDILSAIAHAKIGSKSLPDKDKVHEALLLLVGGDETTRHVISGGIVALLENRQQYEKLVNDLVYLDSTVEEMLRWVTPVKTLARTVTKDCELAGQHLNAGDKVILLFESGNRDESFFQHPDKFDISRNPNRHLSFGGYGRHHCLGAHLARLEIRVMLEEILRRMPNIEIDSRYPLNKRLGTFVLGFERVDIKF